MCKQSSPDQTAPEEADWSGLFVCFLNKLFIEKMYEFVLGRELKCLLGVKEDLM